jgi:uncharacterized membrane protein (DUF4010 family)
MKGRRASSSAGLDRVIPARSAGATIRTLSSVSSATPTNSAHAPTPTSGPLSVYLVAPALLALIVVVIGALKSDRVTATETPPRNPLQLRSALQMAVLFQVVLMVVHGAREAWGASGVFTSAAVLGLTDVDALTVSMTKDVADSVSPAVASAAIAVGVLSNTGLKMALALFLGSHRFRVIAGCSLTLMLVALAGALAVRLV